MTINEIKKLSCRLHKDSQIRIYYNGHHIADASVSEVSVEDNKLLVYYKSYNHILTGNDAYCEVSKTGPFSVKIVGEE